MSAADDFSRLVADGPLLATQVRVCRHCGSLVLNNANALQQHQKSHCTKDAAAEFDRGEWMGGPIG